MTSLKAAFLATGLKEAATSRVSELISLGPSVFYGRNGRLDGGSDAVPGRFRGAGPLEAQCLEPTAALATRIPSGS